MQLDTALNHYRELMAHHAMVFDCTAQSSTVYHLKFNPELVTVEAETVAESAGVAELLGRKAGSWFVRFALHHWKQLGDGDCVAMVGTQAWHDASEVAGTMSIGHQSQEEARKGCASANFAVKCCRC